MEILMNKLYLYGVKGIEAVQIISYAPRASL